MISNQLTSQEYKIKSVTILESTKFGRISLLLDSYSTPKILAIVQFGNPKTGEMERIFEKIKKGELIGATLQSEGFSIEKSIHNNSRLTPPFLVEKYLKVKKARNVTYSLFAKKNTNKYYIGYISEFIKE